MTLSNIFFVKNKSAQSSFELVAIIGILVFVVLAAIGVVLHQSGNAARDKDRAMLEGVANIVQSEVNLALDAGGDYYREFELPQAVGGEAYSIEMPSPSEIVFSTGKAEYVLFLSENVSGAVKKGGNTLKKSGGTLSLNS